MLNSLYFGIGREGSYVEKRMTGTIYVAHMGNTPEDDLKEKLWYVYFDEPPGTPYWELKYEAKYNPKYGFERERDEKNHGD